LKGEGGKMKFDYNDWERVFWFMFGMITAGVQQKYGWWGLATIPIWFVISHYLKKAWDWKPAQRILKDYEKDCG